MRHTWCVLGVATVLSLPYVVEAARPATGRSEPSRTAVSAVAPAGPNVPVFHQGLAEQDGPVFMAAAPNGELWAVWSYRRGLEIDIAISRCGAGGTWSAPELMGRPLVDDVEARLVFLPDGTAVLAWTELRDGKGRVVVMVLRDGAWITPANQVERPGVQPSLFVTGRAVTLAWIGNDGVLQWSVLDTEQPRQALAGGGGNNGPDPIPSGRR